MVLSQPSLLLLPLFLPVAMPFSLLSPTCLAPRSFLSTPLNPLALEPVPWPL